MKARLVKDPKKMFNVYNDLNPAAAKILAFMIFTEKPFTPFKLTYWKLSKLTKVKNPYLSVKELIDKGYISKDVMNKECIWTILIDLVE